MSIDTNSSLACFLTCPKKYQWQYVELYSPIEEPLALRLGTIVHNAIESNLKGMAVQDVESKILKEFRKNIEFARKTGLDTFYLWGVEWWYWMKERQKLPEIWNEAKNLFY